MGRHLASSLAVIVLACSAQAGPLSAEAVELRDPTISMFAEPVWPAVPVDLLEFERLLVATNEDLVEVGVGTALMEPTRLGLIPKEEIWVDEVLMSDPDLDLGEADETDPGFVVTRTGEMLVEFLATQSFRGGNDSADHHPRHDCDPGTPDLRPSAVPEPSTLVLVSMSLPALWLGYRTRFSRSPRG